MKSTTKTEASTGAHDLVEGTVERLRAWKAQQAEERLLAGPLWRAHTYESRPLDPVFTKQDGGLVARQQIDTLLRRAAEKVGHDFNVSAPTLVAGPWPTTLSTGTTSVTSPATSAMPAQQQPPGTSAVSANAP